MDRYSSEGREERYADLCREVVRTNPNLIVAVTGQLVQSLKASTNTIPIVGQMGDSVAFGIVDSIARPRMGTFRARRAPPGPCRGGCR